MVETEQISYEEQDFKSEDDVNSLITLSTTAVQHALIENLSPQSADISECEKKIEHGK